MAYDFDTLIDRDPAVRGTGKYRIMKDSKGNKPPKGIVPFSVADMEFKTAPEIIEAIKAEADYGVFGYHRLTDSFRQSCCDWMKRRHNWQVSPEWIIPFEQVVPALYNAIYAFTNPGDGIIVQIPAYHHFFHATQHCGRTVVENPLKLVDGKYYFDFDDLRKKAKSAKMLMLCSPYNPVGRVWTEEELKELGDICIENGVLVIADEIHHDLIQKPFVHKVFASLGEKYAKNCIVTTSLSKTFNLAGLCFASIIIPDPEIRSKFTKQMNILGFLHINRLGVVAAEAAYRHGDAWLDELNEYIKGNYDFFKAFMADKFPGVKVYDMEGTYLAWFDMSSLGLSSKDLDVFLTDDAMLYLDPDTAFGVKGECFQRINLACPRKLLSDALDRLYAAAEAKKLV